MILDNAKQELEKHCRKLPQRRLQDPVGEEYFGVSLVT